MHQDLRMAGSLPPLDAPHHLRASEWGPYREGIVKESDSAWGSVLDIGLEQVGRLLQSARLVLVQMSIHANTPLQMKVTLLLIRSMMEYSCLIDRATIVVHAILICVFQYSTYCYLPT